MSETRPTVAAQLVASLIESTPDRVRRRLDQAPQAAAGWTWQASAETWSVDTGGETVTMPLREVLAVEHVRCTCLLSPRCFHVLACLTSLEAAVEEVRVVEVEVAVEDADTDAVEASAAQKTATHSLVQAVAQVLRVGAANAGLLVQSALLRAVHQCRAEELHRTAALGLRVITGVGELRARARSSDPAQLAVDVAELLECARHIVHDPLVESFWIGTARRAQKPVRPRTLHGLFAEPIMTRSGYAGAAVYFLGEDDQIYSASDVRPGDAQMARDAYKGGIEIGPLVQPARQLARGRYLGADMTASRDGRLGRGKKVRIVEQGASSWQDEAVQARFQRPLAEQANAVYAQAALPADAQAAGWDFVFLTGAVVGAVGPELLFQTPARLVRLAIANESPALLFRENLRMLSQAPRLRLQIIARFNPLEPDVVFPLALAPAAGEPAEREPRLELPASLVNRVCLGFDEIESKQLTHRQASPVILSEAALPSARGVDPIDSLRRRWIATMLSGIASQRHRQTSSLAAEMSALVRHGFKTGAELLDALSHSTSEAQSTDAYLAASIYLRHCGFEMARQQVTY